MALAAEAAEALAAEAGWIADDVTRLVLGITEAVGNAVAHGPGGEIHLGLERVGGDMIRAEVSDQGHGPLPRQLANAALPEATEVGGRGLYILQVVSDRIEVRDGVLHLEFRSRRIP